MKGDGITADAVYRSNRANGVLQNSSFSHFSSLQSFLSAIFPHFEEFLSPMFQYCPWSSASDFCSIFVQNGKETNVLSVRQAADCST